MPSFSPSLETQTRFSLPVCELEGTVALLKWNVAHTEKRKKHYSGVLTNLHYHITTPHPVYPSPGC